MQDLKSKTVIGSNPCKAPRAAVSTMCLQVIDPDYENGTPYCRKQTQTKKKKKYLKGRHSDVG